MIQMIFLAAVTVFDEYDYSAKAQCLLAGMTADGGVQLAEKPCNSLAECVVVVEGTAPRSQPNQIEKRVSVYSTAVHVKDGGAVESLEEMMELQEATLSGRLQR